MSYSQFYKQNDTLVATLKNPKLDAIENPSLLAYMLLKIKVPMFMEEIIKQLADIQELMQTPSPMQKLQRLTDLQDRLVSFQDTLVPIAITGQISSETKAGLKLLKDTVDEKQGPLYEKLMKSLPSAPIINFSELKTADIQAFPSLPLLTLAIMVEVLRAVINPNVKSINRFAELRLQQASETDVAGNPRDDIYMDPEYRKGGYENVQKAKKQTLDQYTSIMNAVNTLNKIAETGKVTQDQKDILIAFQASFPSEKFQAAIAQIIKLGALPVLETNEQKTMQKSKGML